MTSASSASTSCLKECPGDFAYSPPRNFWEFAPVGELAITSCNLAAFTSAIDRTRRIFSQFSFSAPNPVLKLEPPIERAPSIGWQLNLSGSPIICGQEVFCRETEEILAKALDTYYVVKRVGDGQSVLQTSSASSSFLSSFSSAIAPLQLSSGLFFASQFPIKHHEITFRRFTNLVSEDKLATKGVLRVPVEIPLIGGEVGKVVFFVTHLQAQKEHKKTRQEQLGSLLAWMQEDQETNPGTLLFLAGDLNVSPVEDDGQPSTEKQELRWFFSQFEDFYSGDHDATGRRGAGTSCRFLENDLKNSGREEWELQEATGSFYNMYEFGADREIQGCKYDYTLLYTGDRNESGLKSHTEIRRFLNGLSDHLPLTTVVNLPASLKRAV